MGKKIIKEIGMFMACFGIILTPLILQSLLNSWISIEIAVILSYISIISLFLTPVFIDNKYDKFFESAHNLSKIIFIISAIIQFIFRTDAFTYTTLQVILFIIYIFIYLLEKQAADKSINEAINKKIN